MAFLKVTAIATSLLVLASAIDQQASAAQQLLSSGDVLPTTALGHGKPQTYMDNITAQLVQYARNYTAHPSALDESDSLMCYNMGDLSPSERAHGNYAPMNYVSYREIMRRVRHGAPFAWMRFGDADMDKFGEDSELISAFGSTLGNPELRSDLYVSMGTWFWRRDAPSKVHAASLGETRAPLAQTVLLAHNAHTARTVKAKSVLGTTVASTNVVVDAMKYPNYVFVDGVFYLPGGAPSEAETDRWRKHGVNGWIVEANRGKRVVALVAPPSYQSTRLLRQSYFLEVSGAETGEQLGGQMKDVSAKHPHEGVLFVIVAGWVAKKLILQLANDHTMDKDSFIDSGKALHMYAGESYFTDLCGAIDLWEPPDGVDVNVDWGTPMCKSK